MTRTFKDQQVELLFEPQTEDDKALVEMFTAASRLANEHKGDRKYGGMIAFMCGAISALGRSEGTSFNGVVVQEKSRALLDEFIASFHGGGDDSTNPRQ